MEKIKNRLQKKGIIIHEIKIFEDNQTKEENEIIEFLSLNKHSLQNKSFDLNLPKTAYENNKISKNAFNCIEIISKEEKLPIGNVIVKKI